MKVIVTGAYGQLGSEINKLAGEYPGLDVLYTDIDTLDITDVDAVKAFVDETHPDALINCAAYTAVDRAETDVDRADEINHIAPEILARSLQECGAQMIHVSTDYVFSGDASLPYTEEDAVAPTGVYGRTKLMGEEGCLKENPSAMILRTSWLYSEFGNNFVKTMLRLGEERGVLNVVFDQVGTPTCAEDLARFILDVLKRGKFIPGIYHYSNEGVASWYDFSRTIFEISGISCAVTPVRSGAFPTPAKRPAFSVLDKGKIKNTFGIEIPYWKDSLKKCIERIQNAKS